jgi:short-subunit dehydrogenase
MNRPPAAVVPSPSSNIGGRSHRFGGVTDEKRIAVVTGASAGIGEAIARRLAARGWRCVLVARREDRLRALANEIGGEVELCDVADREAVDALAARILERHPAVHLLVNNAGIPARGNFLKIDLDRVRRVIEVNYLGGVWCTRALMPGLEAAAKDGGAHVVNLVSVAGTAAFAPAGAYAASKHAQLAFSRSLAAALRGSGIRVHTVLPGFVETEGFPQKGVLSSPLLGRFVIQPPRVAKTVVDAVEKGKTEVTVPWFPYRLISIAQAVMPRVVGRFSGMSDYRPGSIPMSYEPDPEDSARSLSRPTHSAKSGSTSE